MIPALKALHTQEHIPTYITSLAMRMNAIQVQQGEISIISQRRLTSVQGSVLGKYITRGCLWLEIPASNARFYADRMELLVLKRRG
jgi:hypothetical protein